MQDRQAVLFTHVEQGAMQDMQEPLEAKNLLGHALRQVKLYK
jgi:hypothetical protein